MKPGSLVVMFGHHYPEVYGIIIRKSYKYIHPHNPYSDQWWEVLCNNKIIIDMEEYIKLVE